MSTNIAMTTLATSSVGIVVVLLTSGCVAGTVNGGPWDDTVSCGDELSCPDGFSCVDGTCIAEDDGDLDAPPLGPSGLRDTPDEGGPGALLEDRSYRGELMTCPFPSTTFGDGRFMLCAPAEDDLCADKTSDSEILVFEIPDLPSPSAIVAAVLLYSSRGADHPGEEGYIYVNGNGPFDVRAETNNTDADTDGWVPIDDFVVEGTNLVEFTHATMLPTTYRIGDVYLEITGYFETCP